MSAAVLLLAVGACAAPAQPVAAPEPAGAAPAPELAPFYEQRIVFEPCTPYATTSTDEALFADERFDCARVQVPLDYSDPDGPRGEVALLRAKARGERIGSLVVNPGGPGGLGTNMVAITAPKWDALGIGDRFDVVGVDPRGVGASTPRIDCYTDAEQDAMEAVNDAAVPLDVVPDVEAAREVARRCAGGSGGADVLTSMSTTNAARDMDVVRAVLGDEKLSFLGYSYGTELGAVYAEAFPQNVRAMVLDGAVDPEAGAAGFRTLMFAAYQRSFEKLAGECAAEPDCPLGTDPARATERFQAIMRPLAERPLPTTDGRGLTFDGAMTGVLAGVRVDRLRPVVVQGIAEAAAGRGDVLQSLFDAQLQRRADGVYNYDLDSLLAIRCMDSPRRTPAEQTDLLRELHRVAPIVDRGRPVAQVHHECAAWPAPPDRPDRWLTGDVDVPPTLVVSVTGDPGTPHQGGINLARALDASLLTVVGDQHGIALFGQNDCVDRIAIDYLVHLRTPPDDARCGG